MGAYSRHAGFVRVTLISDLSTYQGSYTGQQIGCDEDSKTYQWDGDSWNEVTGGGGGLTETQVRDIVRTTIATEV